MTFLIKQRRPCIQIQSIVFINYPEVWQCHTPYIRTLHSIHLISVCSLRRYVSDIKSIAMIQYGFTKLLRCILYFWMFRTLSFTIVRMEIRGMGIKYLLNSLNPALQSYATKIGHNEYYFTIFIYVWNTYVFIKCYRKPLWSQ